MELQDRFRGAIVGLAVGDALGYATEFVSSLSAIRARWGPEGVTGFVSAGHRPPGTFTDDTQMSIAVARALARAGHSSLDELMRIMSAEFVAWSRSPDNNRAPGGTCLAGCSSLRGGVEWRRAGVAESKGCGAAMRAAPVGLFFHGDDAGLVRMALAQSAPTHRHPTGFASSVAAAAAVAWVTRGGSLTGLIDFVESSVRTSESQLAEMGCEPRLIDSHGVAEMMSALERTRDAVGEEAEDVCELLGGGWIGEEAVACALWCVLKAEGDFRQAALRGANSSGDSDSIACIAGSIAGALGGLEGVPREWVREVEDGPRLDALAQALYRASAATSEGTALGTELDFFGVAADAQLLAAPDHPGDADDEARDETDDERELADLTIAEIEQRIEHHNHLYWDLDAPEISDYEYDRLVRHLQETAPDAAVLSALGPSPRPLGEGVEHNVPMLSLDKCYGDEELEKWLGSFEGDVVAMPKFDGVACALHYGSHGHLRLAATRGDGSVGDDVTQSALAIEAIPSSVDTTRPIEVRGEIYMRLSVFERYKAEGMANPRNLAAGAIKQKDPDRCAAYGLSFVPYDLLGTDAATQVESLDELAMLGFEAVDRQVLPREVAREGYDHFAGRRPSLDYEIDGVVFKANVVAEQRRLGQTAHHPRYAIAYKFQGESGISELREVEWSVARTGAITPVAVVAPVTLSGATVSRASLHHAGFVRKLGLTEAAELVLTRRGGVIPNVESVARAGTDPVAIPERCPACGADVHWQQDFLFCARPETCRSAVIGRLSHYAETAGMVGFGSSILEQAYDAELLRSPLDFYSLSWEHIAGLERCGEKLGRKLAAEINKSRTQSLATFLRALGVAELGKHVSKLLAERYGTLEAVLGASEDELAQIHSIGETIAGAVVAGLAESKALIEGLRRQVAVVSPDDNPAAGGPLSGQSFVFTGKLTRLDRKEASRSVQRLGGEVPSTVHSSLTYLVLGEAIPGGASTKERSARRFIEQGATIQIISEQRFLELLRAADPEAPSPASEGDPSDQMSLF